jgi:hypothetical protein
MTERLWGIVLGLLIGANLGGHILRLTLLGFSPITPRHSLPCCFLIPKFGVVSD